MNNRYCIIPARSGSKGLKHKNMLRINGHHMIEYSILCALDSKLFNVENIIVTTDSQDYIDVLKQNYPITYDLRPEEFSTDSSTTFDLLNYLIKQFDTIENFALLQPTSPFRDSTDLVRAMELFEKSDVKSVISMCKAEKSRVLYTELSDDLKIIDNIGVDLGYRRQEKKVEYIPNGSLFISNAKTYIKERSFFTDNTKAYLMTGISNIDVDGDSDFMTALGQIYFDYGRRADTECHMYATAFAEKLEDHPSDVWFIGDSRTANFEPKDKRVCVAAIPGSTLESFVFMLENSKIKPKKLVVNAGINDLRAYGGTKLLETYRKLIEISKVNKIELKIVLPIDTSYVFKIDNDALDTIKQTLKLYESENISIVDLNELFGISLKLNPHFTNDGLHLTDNYESVLFCKLNTII